MRQGILWREWRHQDESGRITRLRALRLASMADRHLLVQCVTIMPENFSGLDVPQKMIVAVCDPIYTTWHEGRRLSGF
jgi:trehalose/maltose hydrolase-like predicted phosphorylase